MTGSIKSSRIRAVLVALVILASGIGLLNLSGCLEIIDKLESYLEAAHELWKFNGSILIAWKGRLVINKSYGMANEIIGLPNTSQTKFFIGSITKQFTATAIMILKERQLIDLDRSIDAYLPDFNHEYADRITSHHLLTHSSGLPNYTDRMEFYLKRMDPFNPDELLETIQNERLIFEPGIGFHYSNTGYILLGAIIERISGQSYEAFLHKEIFKPLNMTNTGYGRREAGHPNRADGYTLDESGQLDAAVPIEFSFLHSAGALYSTVEDMLKWDNFLRTGGILKPASIQEMISPQVAGYGYGWFIDYRFGYVHTYHDGLIDGYNSIISRWPGVGLLIVIFSNDDMAPVNKMASGLAGICFTREVDFPVKKEPFDLDKKRYADYPGAYRGDEGFYLIVDYLDDELVAGPVNQPKHRIIPQGPDTFFFEIDNTRLLVFDNHDKNEINTVEEIDGERTLTFHRLPEEEARHILIDRSRIEIDNLLLDRFTGRYRLESAVASTENDFELEVSRAEGKILARLSDSRAIELYPNSSRSFFHENADLLLTFRTDSLGRATGCLLRIGLTEYVGRRID